MHDFLTGVRAIDLTAFDAALRVEMGSLGVTDADRSLMLARADSGFVAGTAARAATHDQVETLIDAALELHTFLVANESNIEYVPASSITTDPILEASPSTPEIRTAMEDLIDAVTGALSDLNYLDLVTAEGLWATVLAQGQEADRRHVCRVSRFSLGRRWEYRRYISASIDRRRRLDEATRTRVLQ